MALIDARRIGKATTLFAEITQQSQAEDVGKCHLMAGTADYLIKIMALDTEDFACIPRQHLSRLPGVRQMQSSFALRTVVKTTALSV